MRNPLKNQRDAFFQLSAEFSASLLYIHKALSEGDELNALALKIVEVNHQSEQIKLFLNQFQSTLTFTLMEEEYIRFCDLVICGSEMAEYLLASPYPARGAKRHAIYWQKFITEFKPLLKGVVNYFTEKKVSSI